MKFFWRISIIILLLMSGWNGVIAAELCSLLQSCAPVSQTESVAAAAEIVESRACCAHDRSPAPPAASHCASEAQSNANSSETDMAANHSSGKINIHAPGTETSCTHCAGRGNVPAPSRIVSQTSAAKPEAVGDNHAPGLISFVASVRSLAPAVFPPQGAPPEHARPKHLLISVFRI